MENKSFLKPYICTQCGGNVNRATLVCEMCGTRFKDVSESGIARIVVSRPGVVTLGQSISVDLEDMQRNPKEISEYAMRRLAGVFAECIAPYMDVEMENRPEYHSTTIRAKVRLLKPDYRF